jgi:ADP-dependent NAD(P)H-hydrate dehydratase / NAD(P)H-hydrate epimerase
MRAALMRAALMRAALTAEEMRAVDAATMELGIPGIVLMENAAHRVIELLEREFAPLSKQRIVVICGKGNNGGDGLAIARQLYTRFRPQSLDVVLAADPDELRGDAAANLAMLRACGCSFSREITGRMSFASLVVDALLGTGLAGPARGPALEMIRRMNTEFPLAKVVAVDLPSGIGSDSGQLTGEFVRADFTVTFTSWKVAHVLSPACFAMGKASLGAIGSPDHLMESCCLRMTGREDFRALFEPRPKDSNKGSFGHVLVIAGSRGRTGAAAMCGLAVLRSGAGLATVATAESALGQVAGYSPELMTDALRETASGAIADQEIVLGKKSVVAIGPGLGTEAPTVGLVRRMFRECPVPMVVDADALNGLAGTDWHGGASFRVLTPHPGEMARLTGNTISEVQTDRVGCARALARERGVVLVLKGERTLIALPDGRVWVNPTGSPAMATGGSGDILTGMIAGMLAQFPATPELAVAAAVYLHGRAGELGAMKLTEQAFVAGDLLTFLPDAIHDLYN